MAITSRLHVQRAIDAMLREFPRGRIEPPPAPAPQSLQERRRDLWIGTAIATAGSSNCTSPHSAAKFANQAVADFDKLVDEGRL